MALVTYKVRALDPRTNKIINEKIEAETEDAVRSTLTARSLTPLEITPPAKGLNMEITFIKKKVKKADLAVFARMFATMIGAGMKILRALEVTSNQTENPTLKEALDQVMESVKNGSSLSDAMAEYPVVFPPLMINMVHSGEVGGYLDSILVEIAETYEADVRLNSEIKSASTYPAVVLAMGVVGSAVMLIFIVPIFASLFSDLGGQLPLPTRMMMGLSEIMKWMAVPLIVAGAVFGAWWGKNKHRKEIRRHVDPLMLRLPVFGPLFSKIALTRFCRNLSVMLTSGVQILEALNVVGSTAGNVVVADSVDYTAEMVRRGHTMGEYLGHDGVFPDLVVQMVAVGEDSGEVDTMLKRVSEFYEQQVEATTKRLASLLEPLLIVLMGVMLGSIVISMYLPLFSIFDLIQA